MEMASQLINPFEHKKNDMKGPLEDDEKVVEIKEPVIPDKPKTR